MRIAPPAMFHGLRALKQSACPSYIIRPLKMSSCASLSCIEVRTGGVLIPGLGGR